MTRNWIRRIGLSVLLGLAAAGTQAQVLYGSTGGGGNPAAQLGTINQATGAFTPIGAIGFAVTGLAVHPTTGVLYGSTGGSSPVSPNSIITINTTTGAGTLVGAAGGGCTPADITFRSDGVLFGWCEGPDSLATFNLGTGAATIVGASGLGTFGSGIAFDNGGTLYYAGSGGSGMFRTINPATGAPTNVAALTGAPQPGGSVNAMANNPTTNVLFAVNAASAGLGSATNLVTINKATAVVTNIGASVANLDGIAFAPLAAGAGASIPVPTLSEWATILLALLIAAAAVVALRRKPTQRR